MLRIRPKCDNCSGICNWLEYDSIVKQEQCCICFALREPNEYCEWCLGRDKVEYQELDYDYL